MRARVGVIVALVVGLVLDGCSLLLSDDLASDGSSPADEAGATDSGGGGADADATTPGSDGGATDARVDVDADAALDPSLVAFWTFDNGNDTSQLDETKRFTLEVATASIDAAGGVRGGALVLLGAEMPRVDALSSASYPKKGTLSFWFKYTWPDDDTQNHGVFDDWDDDRSHMFIRRIGSETPGRFQTALQPQITSSSYAWVQGFDTQRDTWTHVVMTWDSVGRAAALYVNGTVVKSSNFINAETFEPSSQSFEIGSGFLGSMDEIRLYDRVLSSSEVALIP